MSNANLGGRLWMRLEFSCVHVCDKSSLKAPPDNARTWRVKREESICSKRAIIARPCMVFSKLLVNNLVTKLFEMLLWKCNFISLHMMSTARECFKRWYSKHIELTPYAVLYAAYFIAYTYLPWQGGHIDPPTPSMPSLCQCHFFNSSYNIFI